MNRIGPAIDRPIPTEEKTVAAEQTSETESTQKTGVTGQTPLEVEQSTKEKAPASTAKGQQFESHLGGLAFQAELQAQLPTNAAPVIKDLPDANPNLDPNVHMDGKIDVKNSLPDGQAINSGLSGFDTGKTGPDHMGVDFTTGGMKSPSNVLADVLQGRDGKSIEGGGVKGNSISNGRGTPPPGAELNFRAPNGSLVGQATAEEYQTIIGPGPKPAAPNANADKQTARNEAKVKDHEVSEETKKLEAEWKKKNTPDAGTKMTNPDADGGDGTVRGGSSPQEMERALKARFGQVEHSINPDLGANGGPTGPTPGERHDPMKPVRDPIGDGNDSNVTVSEEAPTLAADIHGPRYVNSDAGVQSPNGGHGNGTGNPNTGNPS